MSYGHHQVTISGFSDDLFEIDCGSNKQYSEEYGCYDEECVVEFKAPTGERLVISGIFLGEKGWKFTIRENNTRWYIEEIPLETRFGHQNVFVLTLPDRVVITRM